MSEIRDVSALKRERDQILDDYYSNIIPLRMPVNARFTQMILSEYGGVDPMRWHYDTKVLEDVMDEFADRVYSDAMPFSPPGFVSRPAAMYQLLGSQSFILAENGCTQHPEVVGMPADDYPELIEKGFDYLVEKVIPRQYRNLDPADPIRMAWAIQLEQTERNAEIASILPFLGRLSARKGYASGPAPGSGGFAEAPYDFLADQLRSFSGVSVDIRRRREEVKEAVEVLLPLMFKMGMPTNINKQSSVGYPLHMPTFMREKDFLELYMPTWKRLIRENAARGARPSIFLEDDWTRYLDIVKDEFPAGCTLMLDEGDPRVFKEKLGEKFMLTGMFPFQNMRSCDTPALLDRAKEFLDIMLPGGGYIFNFDKSPLVAADLDVDKYAALLEFVRDYSYYPNAGEKFGIPLNAEGFVPDPAFDQPLASRYLFDWEKFRAEYPLAPDVAKEKFENANRQVFTWYMNLLV